MMDTLRELREKLEDYSRRRAQRAGWTLRFIPTNLTKLDAALPCGGLPSGAVTEILANDYGVGSMSLAMRIARRCAGGERHDQAVPSSGILPVGTALSTDIARADGRSIVLVDAVGDFYPPAVCQHGLAPEQLIVVRTKSEKDALWATDQSLRCPAVAVVIASLKHLDHRVSRRLQLAAESSGCVGLVLRPARLGTKSFAAVQILVEGVAVVSTPHRPRGADATQTLVEGIAADNGFYPCRVTLLKAREGSPAGPLWVDLHHATGAMFVHPVPLNRPVAQPA